MNGFSHLESYLEQLCHQHPSFGVAVAIANGGKIEYINVIGRYNDEGLNADTPLAVASLTKPVFAYLALKLCEQGVLDLDTPLAQYLPEAYLTNEPYLPVMTARHALSHTTGFPNWREASGLKAAFYPGSAFHYSTEGLLYLQTVVEHLTQRSLPELMEQRVFEPFGMTNSLLVREDLSAWQPYLPGGLRAYGGLSLHTTASDYARFLIEVMRANAADEFRLNSITMSQMMTPHIKVGDREKLSWGLGWGIQHGEPEDSFWHFGVKRVQNGHTYNFALGYPAEQIGIVILTSQTVGLSLCETIAQLILGASKPLPAFRWLLPPDQWRADGRKVAISNQDASS